MYEDAYKQQPANEELGQQTFFANARIGNWKAAQQVGAHCECFLNDTQPWSDCYQNAQAVPRRQLLVLECHERFSPGMYYMLGHLVT